MGLDCKVKNQELELCIPCQLRAIFLKPISPQRQRVAGHKLGMQILSVVCFIVSVAAAVGSVASIVLDLQKYKPFHVDY